jgi:thymidylate synthase
VGRHECYDPACLQSIWCRLLEEAGQPVLSMNARFRSNAAYKAAFMNILALGQLQQRSGTRIAELSGHAVQIGRYVHLVDSDRI